MPKHGSTTERGYGYEHRKLRQKYDRQVRAGQATCWRCGTPIAPNGKWDLGHADAPGPDGKRRHMGPEHIGRECPAGGNRATNGRRQHTPPSPPPAALSYFDTNPQDTGTIGA